MDKGGDLIPEEDKQLLGDKPSETRALINQSRWEYKNKNIYDPYIEQFKPEYLKKKNNGIRNLRKMGYSDEEIINMLNSISSREQTVLPIAQEGIPDIFKQHKNKTK